jgi:amidohydrolase
MKSIIELAQKYEPNMIAYRRHLHQHPELGGNEIHTVEFIVKQLKEMGLETNTGYSQHGVTAMIGNNTGKTVMLRGDIDALPIKEEADVPFKSLNEGVMHACGHDIHTSALLGAAKILTEIKDELKGNVKLCFQPAEEVKDQGACICVKDGVLESPRVDFVVGLHVNPSVPVGMVSLEPGPVTSFPDGFRLKFIGVPTHGSMPDKGKDPILPAVMAYQMINSIQKHISAMEPSVVQVTLFRGGQTENIVPTECEIGGTTRTLTKETREYVKSGILGIAEHISEIYSVSYEFNGFTSLTCPVVNYPPYVPAAKKCCEGLIPGGFYEEPLYKLGGEDFSYFTKEIPGLYFNLGTHNDNPNTMFPVHNSYFNPDERSIAIGALIYASVAKSYLNGDFDE